MNIRSIFEFAFALSIALLTVPALAQGPGGGGFNPGGGGGGPGGGGSSGSFAYDAIASDVTNADHTVTRTDGGLLYRLGASPTAVSASSNVFAIADGLFAGCTTLVTADLSVTSIAAVPSDCFAGCTALTTVVLPDTCTSIGPNAFAGCTALSSVTAPAIATVAADAFRGCTALSALPAFLADATLGPYAFAASGLTTLDLATLVPSAGTFATCAALANASNAPAALPDALFSGCTALAFAPSACTAVGQAALAGVPFDTISLDWETDLSPYAFAADAATVDTLLDTAHPEYLARDPTVFLGRTLSYDTGNGIARIEAADLVDWLFAQTLSPIPTVAQPASYATADLEAWLDDPSNLDDIYAYASDPDLTVSGNTFLFTPPDPDATSVRVTLESTTNLLDAASWTPDALALDPDASTSSLLVYTSSNSSAFARLSFSPAW